MKESLVKIYWKLFSGDEEVVQEITEIELDSDEETGETIIIGFDGIDKLSEFFVDEIGQDIFDEKGLEMIKDHIRKERNPIDLDEILPLDFDIDAISRNPDWEAPKDGECIMVIKINSFQSNHPLDPVEWDTEIECLGILGDQVKLTY